MEMTEREKERNLDKRPVLSASVAPTLLKVPIKHFVVHLGVGSKTM